MKKTITTLLLSLAISIHSWALNLIVSGSFDSQVNGLYVETGTQNGQPYFVKSGGGGMNYAIGYNGFSWRCGEEMMPGMIMGMDQSSDAGSPPLTGWMEITIAPEGKSLSFKVDKFVENKKNDGSVDGRVIISYNKFGGDKLSGVNGENFVENNKVTVTNVPAGLTASVIRNSDSTLTLKLSGNATSHTGLNNISNLTITFNNSALEGNDVSEVSGKSKADFTVNFRKVITVAASGADYSTIAGALAASTPFDIIQIAEGTYTEFNLTTSNPLLITGAGASKTIIQAAASVGTASGRVFKFNHYSDTTELNNLTVQNGYVFEGNPYGGGVYSEGNLKIVNSVIKNNTAKSTGIYSGLGGGILCQGSLMILNSEISGNKLEGGQTFGGGICANGVNNLIINSTFSNNIVVSDYAYGGGISTAGKSYFLNCTFNSNIATNGSGINLGGNSELKNNILFGNTGSDNVNLNGTLDITALNNITDANSIAKFNNISTNNVSSDPLLGSLANNGGETQTIALLANSPAINAGAENADVPHRDQRGMYHNGTRDIGAFEFDGLSCLKPVFTKQPLDQNLCVGDSIHLNSEAIGDSIQYVMYMSLNKLSLGSEIGGTNKFDGLVSPDDLGFSGKYFVFTASNGCGGALSDFALLIINAVDTTVSLTGTTLSANANDVTYQWIDCDNNGATIDGATSKTFTPTVSGNYAVIIDNAKCAKDTSTCHFVDIVTGLQNASFSNFNIYPNPATDHVTVTLTESVSGSVSIVDLNGSLVTTKSISGNALNISTANLANGVYVVKIATDKGVEVKQLIIKH